MSCRHRTHPCPALPGHTALPILGTGGPSAEASLERSRLNRSRQPRRPLMAETPTFGRYAEIPFEQMTQEQQEGYR
ncbi:MAG TPA: hypothetical protein VIH59_34445 [Candidatus Tectomicrobia bacterium]